MEIIKNSDAQNTHRLFIQQQKKPQEKFLERYYIRTIYN